MKKIIFIAFLLIPFFHNFSGLNAKTKCISGDCFNGSGTKVYSTGSKYVGEFKDGKENGTGTYYFYNGSKYEGQWLNGNFHGKGKWTYSNGAVLKGGFEDGKMSEESEIIPVSKDKEARYILDILPIDTELFIKFDSIESLYRNFSVRENSFFGKPVHDLKEFIKKAGFNPLSLWELKSLGIDTRKEIGVVVSDVIFKKNSEPGMNIFCYVPVKDGEKITGKFINLLKNLYKNVKHFKKGKINIFEKQDGKRKIYLFQKNNYLFFGANPNGNPEKFINKILNGNKFISESNNYKNVKVKVSPNEEVLIFCNINKIVNRNYKSIINLFKDMPFYSNGGFSNIAKMLKDYKSGIIAVDFDSKDLKFEGVYEIVPGSKSLNLLRNYKNDRINLFGINKNPLMLMLLGVNVQEYYKYMMKVWPKNFIKVIKDAYKDIKKKYNISVEKEIINNFAGSINLAVFDGSSINMMNYNTLITINVKKSRLMNGVLKKIFAKIPDGKYRKEKIGKVDVYVISAGFVQVYVGLKDRVFIIASNRSIFEESLKRKASKGFLKGIKDEELKKILKGKTSLFYLKSDEVLKAVDNFAAFTKKIKPETKKIIKKFNYLLFSGWQKKNFFYSNIMVKTKFNSPFFIELKRIVNKGPITIRMKKKIK